MVHLQIYIQNLGHYPYLQIYLSKLFYLVIAIYNIYNQFKQAPKKRRTKKQMTEVDLLSELAKLMTKLDYHQSKEEYEVCAEIKKQIDDVNDKLSKL